MPRRQKNRPPLALQSYAEQIRKHRRAYKMSQAQLARLAGTTQATVSAIEAGKGNPSIGLLNDLAAAFNSEIHVQIRRQLKRAAK